MDREDLKSSLLKKGFSEERNRDHIYYHHKYEGKITGVKTKVSHGKKYKSLGQDLQSLIKRQLKLDSSSQLRDLVECPLSAENYIDILKEKGLI